MAYMQWATEAIEDVHERLEILNVTHEVRRKFAAFNLPYLALPTQTEPHTALDVFIRTNTSAEPLGDYDVVVALAEARTGQSLHEFVAKVEQASPAAARYYHAGGFGTRCCSAPTKAGTGQIHLPVCWIPKPVN